MSRPRIPLELATRLHRQAEATRWKVSVDRFAEALEAGLTKQFGARWPSEREVERALTALHLRDLALAAACADGSDAAWEHFVIEFRPTLYRAAEAMRPGGGRELADSLYGELFGVTPRGESRSSLFRYFHARSSLATWLRAILAQRLVDVVRVERRHDPLPDDDAITAGDTRSTVEAPKPERARWVSAMKRSMAGAVAALHAKDRLRLGLYYVESLTLADIGRTLGEHEGTVSRHLTRTRKTLRADVERQLREREGMRDDEIADCLLSVISDAGTLDLTALMGRSSSSRSTAGAATERLGSTGTGRASDGSSKATLDQGPVARKNQPVDRST